MKTKILVFILAVMALVSCAGFTHVTVPQSTINIIGKDVETERYVEYKLTKTYILGIGGMSAKARNTNIIQELMQKAHLKENETLAYISVSKNVNHFLGIYARVNFTASGYVVRPSGERLTETPADNLEDKRSYETAGGYLLVRDLQDKIYYAQTGEELLKIREEVVEHMAHGTLAAKSGTKLLNKIDKQLGKQ